MSKYILPIGSLWKDDDLDEFSSVKNYWRGRSRYARFKQALDVAAAVYLLLSIISLIASATIAISQAAPSIKTISWRSPMSLLATFAYCFTLQSLIGLLSSSVASLQISQFVVFAVLVLFILLHESYWLKEKIMLSAATSASEIYDGVLPSGKSTPRDYRALASSSINHIFLIAVLLTAASFLWNARQLPLVAKPLVKPRLLSAGIFLSVIGAFNVIKALEARVKPKHLGWANAIAAALIGGIAYALILIVGLRRGLLQGRLIFIFAFTFVFVSWLLRQKFVRPPKEDPPANISRSKLETRRERMLHYGVQVPLIALGWVVNVLLIAAEFVVVRIQRVLAKVTGDFAFRAKAVLPHSLYMWLMQIASADERARENDRRAVEWPQIQIVSQSDRGVGAYDLTSQPLPAPIGFDQYVRKRYLHKMLGGASWLTRWVKREPARQIRNAFGGGWDREDPLDFQRNVRPVFTRWPTQAESTLLYRHLIALMFAVLFVAYLVEFASGQIVATFARPIFSHGPGYAVVWGLIAGVVFAVVTIFGRSSLSGLALGLLSGLALAPTLGAVGLQIRAANKVMSFLMAFAVILLTNMLGEQRLLVSGILIFLLGAYLQVVGRG